MRLKAIKLNTDNSDKIYSSDYCQLLLKIYDDYHQEIGYHFPWIGYFVIKENRIVGTCGYKGQPKEGKVKIAYWTFVEYEGQGVSTYSCKELIKISKEFDPTIKITGTTAPEHNASTKILQKNGFTFDGIVQDHEIGNACGR